MNRARTALRAQRIDNAAWFAQPAAQCAQTEELEVAWACAVREPSLGGSRAARRTANIRCFPLGSARTAK